MVTFKTVARKHVVTVDGKDHDFKSFWEALEFAYMYHARKALAKTNS